MNAPFPIRVRWPAEYVIIMALSLPAGQGSAAPVDATTPTVDVAKNGRADSAAGIGDFVRAIDVPAITLPARPPLAPEEIARIKRHIANLALIDSPDMGLSSTYGGSSFVPLPQMTTAGVKILGVPRPQTAGDLVELVKLGPKALPFLLEALDDATPTKLVLGHPLGAEGHGFGGVYRANEISGNPANPAEFAVVGLGGPGYLRGESGLGVAMEEPRHVVTVGDVCFVIIGQITGRSSYRVARYQPTAITIINSPTDDPALVKQVRSIWSADDAERHLLDALLLDFSTTVDVPKEAPRELSQQAFAAWFYSSGAAMRLLYYFPEAAGGLVARRLVRSAGDDTFRSRTYHEFLKAVAWSDHPEVRRNVLALFRETLDPQIFLTCLPAVPETENDLAVRRILALLDALPPDAKPDEWGHGPYDDGYLLVRTAGERLGSASKPVYLHYMKASTFKRRMALCSAVRVRPEWAVEFLAPLLDDKREERMWYQKVAGNDEDRPAIRICDDAAQAISLSRPDLPFVLHGTHADLDRQIAAMKEGIAKSVGVNSDQAASSRGGTTSVSSGLGS